MRTLQEKYNAVLEGKFSKTQFRRDAAMELPQFVSNVNSFDDTVAILKNKGIVAEAQEPKYSTAKPADTIAPDVLDTGIKFELDKKYGTLDVTPEQYEKCKEMAIKNLSKDVLYYVKQDSVQLDTPGEKMEKAKLKEGFLDRFKKKPAQSQPAPAKVLSADEIQAMIDQETKTNTVGDILDAATVQGTIDLRNATPEQVKMFVSIARDSDHEHDTITGDTYIDYLESLPNYKGVAEAIQNIENDAHTIKRIAGMVNQLLQDNPEDESLKAYAISVKNDLESKDPSRLSQYKDILSMDDLKDDMEHYISHDVDQLEEIDNSDYAMKVRAMKNKKPAASIAPKSNPNADKIAQLKKHRAQIMRDMEQEAEPAGGPIADKYGDMLNKIDKAIAQLSEVKVKKYNTGAPEEFSDDDFEKKEYEDYEDENEYDELDEDHSSNPNDKYVVRPCKNKKEPWAVWEGEVRVKGFATKEEAQAYADKQNKEQGLNEEDASIEPKPVGRDTGVKLNIKAIKKHLEGKGYKVDYQNGSSMLNPKGIDVFNPELGSILTITRNGELFGDGNWGTEVSTEKEAVQALKQFENELSEAVNEGDYEPRTKEDLIFKYLRDAWQFGVTNGKDVNPDEGLSQMATGLADMLSDYDSAEPSEDPDVEDLYQHDTEYLNQLKERQALKEMFKKIITKIITEEAEGGSDLMNIAQTLHRGFSEKGALAAAVGADGKTLAGNAGAAQVVIKIEDNYLLLTAKTSSAGDKSQATTRQVEDALEDIMASANNFQIKDTTKLPGQFRAVIIGK